MNNRLIIGFAVIFLVGVFALSLASAVVIDSVSQDKIYPGENGQVSIDFKNNLGEDVESVSLVLDLSMLPLSSVGASEQDVDEIQDGDTETVGFTIKASSDIKPGEYNVPYVLTYRLTSVPSELGNNSGIVVKHGTIGVTVGARTELSYSASVDNPVVGQKGKVTLKIINRGFGDIKFVSTKVSPSGFNLLSSDETYIGTVSSNDFETATFDVVFKDVNAKLNAVVKYKDFDNKDISQSVTLPLTVYTPQQAIDLGIIQQNYTWVYILVVVIIIVLYLVYRRIKKSKKKKKQQEA
ncbi:MAG: hypothetical protein WC796_01235 [Candidatus Pacearchaeota archaeon]|jgi:hypothetical protein